MISRTSIGGGLYRSGSFYWWRPTVAGRRTWRRLSSTSEAQARQEAAALGTDHARSALGLTRSPFATQPRPLREIEPGLPPRILTVFGDLRPDEVTMAGAIEYGRARAAKRAADIELSALSAALTRAVQAGLAVRNPLLGRARLHKTQRHSRACMPRDADELHAIARRLLPGAVGWQFLVGCLTGLRTSELLELRMDAGPKEPGSVEGEHLYVRRQKDGVFPYVRLYPELLDCIAAHHLAHDRVSPWWFPGEDLFRPLSRFALVHALARVSPDRKLTGHGCRAYFVTALRSQGVPDNEVAARIGDRSVGMIASTYGGLAESWAGGEPLGWVPRVGAPAWAEFVPRNVIAL